ncbi:rRNA maturation RNase YbeY [Actinotignum urinale]|uniref:Endoribonuclease YbeY n=1 Tax=Actinotignum urinale TaxID=190146 RepID=A0AAW9HLF1_9ACTO|nr:rRNA maturation RNase YbeY [Actinotignum urinale]MDY5128778.1 rRNA maturation RNase YbeY [Actinotignum urinale]MDY5133362.1 rRNA maturation RNase YbeY [Actinotignum urinale]MDY5152090.1 rRNA maturation RNase YbeY [Actinotignum urinale]MDY5154597.1 rRNA maturation RNase YbeY [Actinotignum urinale]MDY5160200.1 rRNA maturation RNase YbeY [Actinotignum urinale]
MIEVNDESGFSPAPDLQEISDLARYALDYMRVHPQADLSVVLVDEDTMSDLHVKWMDIEGPTDVMSFPMDEIRPPHVGEESRPGMLGDIIVCPSVAQRQAHNMGHSTAEEILLLVTHGILHLLGYDHAEPEEKETMFALQRKILLVFLAERGGGDPRPTEV